MSAYLTSRLLLENVGDGKRPEPNSSLLLFGAELEMYEPSNTGAQRGLDHSCLWGEHSSSSQYNTIMGNEEEGPVGGPQPEC